MTSGCCSVVTFDDVTSKVSEAVAASLSLKAVVVSEVTASVKTGIDSLSETGVSVALRVP